MKKQSMLLAAGALIISASPALATDLREAVQSALNTNPEIRQAISNKEATRAERKHPCAHFQSPEILSGPLSKRGNLSQA